MLSLLALSAGLGAVIITVWYLVCVRLNKRRSVRILSWIRTAFEGHGSVAGVEWVSASRFLVRLRLPECGFRQPCIQVSLWPREMPLRWLASRWRKMQETITFEANLHCAPSFNMEVHNHRWRGRTRRRMNLHSEGLTTHSIGPFVISSRYDWQGEITRMMDALVASRQCEFLKVSFRRNAPHFSATVTLQAFANHCAGEVGIFEVLRELAEGASTSRF